MTLVYVYILIFNWMDRTDIPRVDQQALVKITANGTKMIHDHDKIISDNDKIIRDHAKINDDHAKIVHDDAKITDDVTL